MQSARPINNPTAFPTTYSRIVSVIGHWHRNKEFRKYMRLWQRRYQSRVLARSCTW